VIALAAAFCAGWGKPAGTTNGTGVVSGTGVLRQPSSNSEPAATKRTNSSIMSGDFSGLVFSKVKTF
jgi:hypothetical protein